MTATPAPPPPDQPLNTLTGGETVNLPRTGGLPITVTFPATYP